MPAQDIAPTTDEAALSETLLTAYHARQQPWMQDAVKDDAFYLGDQWDAKDIAEIEERREAASVHNVAGPMCDYKVALLTTNRPQIKAVAREDTDVGMGRVFTETIAAIWDASHAQAALKRALHHYCHRGGRGVLFYWWDPDAAYGKGDIRIDNIDDPLTVYPDPNAKDPLWRDAQHVLVHRVLTYYQATALYPDKVETIRSAAPSRRDLVPGSNRGRLDFDGTTTIDGGRVYDNFHTHYELIDRYTRIKVPYYHIFQVENGREDVMSRADYDAFLASEAILIDDGVAARVGLVGDELEAARALYEELREALGAPEGGPVSFHLELQMDEEGMPVGMSRVPGDETADSVPGSTTIVVPVPVAALYEQGVFTVNMYRQDRVQNVCTIGGKVLYERTLPYSMMPLIPFNNRHTGTPYPKSDIDRIRHLQEQLNFTEQKIIRGLTKQTGTKIIVPQGFWIDDAEAKEKLTSPGTESIHANFDALPEGMQPIVITPQTVGNENYLHVERLVARMERIMGLLEVPGEDQSDTVRGGLLQEERVQRRIRSDLDDIDGALAFLGKGLVEMIQYHYTTERVARLVQPWGEIKSLPLNQSVYDDYGRFIRRINDVTVGSYDIVMVGGSTLPVPRWALAEYYERLAAATLIPKEEFWRKSELFDVERLMEEDSTIAKQQQAIAQLEDRIKELEGLTQRQDSELRHAERRVDLEKTKTQLDRVVNRAERDQQVAGSKLTMEIQRLTDQLKNATREPGGSA